MSSLRAINERISLEFEEEKNLKKLFLRRDLSSVISVFKEMMEEVIDCKNLGTNPPDWADCNCVVCVELPAIIDLLDEAIKIAKKEEL